MVKQTRIYRSDSNNPWYNLAIEEYLLDTAGENECILYLWQNRDTIVVGKNQNPWKECHAVKLEMDGGFLARRLSGGGTVFHDLGNLNFTFLMNRCNYDLQRQVGVILSAVKRLGIAAEMTGRNDLTIDGRKFSGNAFCFRKCNAYHHGTILVSSDFEKLTKYLQVPDEKIHAKGINSVRSRVVNLIEYEPSITIDTMMQAFFGEFTHEYGGDSCKAANTDTLDQEVIGRLYKKYASWDWRYGEAPDFDVEMSTRFVWGGIDICLKLEKGIITRAVVYSDALDEEFVVMLSETLTGLQLNSSVLSGSIADMAMEAGREQMKSDVAAWLRDRSL